MESINRLECEICMSSLKQLYTIKNMPVKLCCLDTPEFDTSTISFSICTTCNTIQLDKLVPLDILYSGNHNTSVVGKTWENYFQFISSKISPIIENKIVLEIGDPSGKIARRLDGYVDWYIVEPNHNTNIVYKSNIHFISAFFDKHFSFDKKIDIIVHSHVFEHIYSPNIFLEKCYDLLAENGEMVFGVPNMEYIGKSSSAPCLGIFFEHTMFLNKENICYMLKKNGFKIIEIMDYENHSTIYHVRKTDKPIEYLQCVITDYTNIFMNTIHEWERFVSSCTFRQYYIFGASYNTQFLLALGLKNVIGILDNSVEKHGKYLSGYQIFSPNILIGKDNCSIIVKNGYYNAEIIDQCIKINDKISIIL